MTAQFSDTVFYSGEAYSLAGVNGSGLFDPETQGLKPIGTCSACWRGYLCEYEVVENRLLLQRLQISIDKEAKALFGVAPEESEDEIRIFGADYKGLSRRVAYSGGLLIAKDFIHELYVHMGFHPAWKYEEVHELVFEKGRLVFQKDCSDRMHELRDALSKRRREPEHPGSREEIEKWIKSTFSLDYR